MQSYFWENTEIPDQKAQNGNKKKAIFEVNFDPVFDKRWRRAEPNVLSLSWAIFAVLI
jgi:hypothetical protein